MTLLFYIKLVAGRTLDHIVNIMYRILSYHKFSLYSGYKMRKEERIASMRKIVVSGYNGCLDQTIRVSRV